MITPQKLLMLKTDPTVAPIPFEEIGCDKLVSSVRVSHRVVDDDNDKPHSCEITLLNIDRKLSSYFRVRDRIEIWLGWEDTPLFFMGQFILDRPEYTYPKTGVPTVILKGKDLVLNLARDKRGYMYRVRMLHEAVREMVKKVGIELDFDVPAIIRKLPVFDVCKSVLTSTWHELKRIAYDLGNLPLVMEWEVKKKKPRVVKGKLLLKNRSTRHIRGPDGKPLVLGYRKGPASTALYSATITFSAQDGGETYLNLRRDKDGEVKETRADPFTGKGEMFAAEFSGTLAIKDPAKQGVTKGLHAPSKLKGLASTKNICGLSCSLRGAPWLFPNSLVKIEGIGEFSGKWYIREVTHTLDRTGFKTDFKCQRGGVKSKPRAKEKKDKSGPFKIHGKALVDGRIVTLKYPK
jgi:hypothetical protein